MCREHARLCGLVHAGADDDAVDTGSQGLSVPLKYYRLIVAEMLLFYFSFLFL
jgi:hypothetical protein